MHLLRSWHWNQTEIEHALNWTSMQALGLNMCTLGLNSTLHARGLIIQALRSFTHQYYNMHILGSMQWDRTCVHWDRTCTHWNRIFKHWYWTCMHWDWTFTYWYHTGIEHEHTGFEIIDTGIKHSLGSNIHELVSNMHTLRLKSQTLESKMHWDRTCMQETCTHWDQHAGKVALRQSIFQSDHECWTCPDIIPCILFSGASSVAFMCDNSWRQPTESWTFLMLT